MVGPLYHGSPYNFEKFDISKIGTGEGAQAYGHGLYFAESPEVARSYRLGLTDPKYYHVPVTVDGQEVLTAAGAGDRSVTAVANRFLSSGDREGAMVVRMVGDAQKYGARSAKGLRALYKENPQLRQSFAGYYNLKPGEFDAALKAVGKRASFGPARGVMYKVNVNAEPEDFLDWDKPLNQQGPKIQRAVGDLLSEGPIKLGHGGQVRLAGGGTLKAYEDPDFGMRYTLEQGGKEFRLSPTDVKNLIGTGTEGKSVYQLLSSKLGSDAKASAYLRERGIQGVKYFDQGSRAGGQGTSNYVLFSDEPIQILERGAIPSKIMAGAGLLGGAGLYGAGKLGLLSPEPRP